MPPGPPHRHRQRPAFETGCRRSVMYAARMHHRPSAAGLGLLTHILWNCSVFGHKVGLPSSENSLEVWRARLQRRSCSRGTTCHCTAHADNTDTFKRRLKTFLFCTFYDQPLQTAFMYCITCNWLVSSAESPQRLILVLLLLLIQYRSRSMKAVRK